MTVDENVFYGKARKVDVYDYIVFNRSHIRYSKTKNSKTEFFRVAIVRESYIPEGLADEVVKAVTSTNDLGLSDSDPQYDYTWNQNTGNVVEALAIEFYRVKKP